MRRIRWIPVALVWLVCAACLAPPVARLTPKVTQETAIRVQAEHNQVDILFLVDNSPSMEAMQGELKQKLSRFFGVFDDLATKGIYADLNIGVVTSDYGAGTQNHRGTD